MKHRLLLIGIASLALLQGCAGVFIAGAAPTASVANDRRTVGSVLDDQSIELKAANAIASRKDMDKASRISATSVNGKVLLVGQTPYSQYSRDAEKLVAKISGVRQVYNELRIRKPIGFGDHLQDQIHHADHRGHRQHPFQGRHRERRSFPVGAGHSV